MPMEIPRPWSAFPAWGTSSDLDVLVAPFTHYAANSGAHLGLSQVEDMNGNSSAAIGRLERKLLRFRLRLSRLAPGVIVRGRTFSDRPRIKTILNRML
jgi:hypothetical protein